MHYGFNIPLRGPLATPAGMAAIARHGETLGFSLAALPDHILIPRAIESRYPYSETGAFPGQGSGDCLEQLSAMAYLAALTSRLRLLSSVMVVPHRGAALTAKMLSTIDVLSGGRLTVGIGAGWLREEFEAIGAPPFAARGRVTDEYLEAFKVLWTEAEPAYQGEFVNFSQVSFLPHPVQRPHPPIWVGGESRAALRRSVNHGDAWYPIGVNPRFPLDTLARYRDAVAQLHELSEAAGRDPGSVGLAYWANWYNEARGEVRVEGARHLFTGSDAAIVEDIGALRELGVGHLLFNFARDDVQASLDAMSRFQAAVLGQLA